MPRIDILLFPEGKNKAFTMSYDDGTIHDRKLLELLNKYMVKGTFNLNGGIFSRKETVEFEGKKTDISTVAENEVIDLYQGHEIASHGYLHASLPTLASGSAAYEVLRDRAELEKLAGYIVKGFAYPFGIFNDSVKNILKTSDIVYARTIKSTNSFEIPEDFLEWNPTCHHNDAQLMQLADEFCNEKSRFIRPEIFYVWGHSYEFAHDDNWDVIEKLLSYISGYRNDIWFATNIEIADYINSYRQLNYSADGKIIYNPTASKIWILIEMVKYCINPGEYLYLK